MEHAIATLRNKIHSHQGYLDLQGHSDVVEELIKARIAELEKAIYIIETYWPTDIPSMFDELFIDLGDNND